MVYFKPDRPSWNDTFLNIAETMSLRATCPRLHVGAVLVRDNGILTAAYNGAPAGFPQCDEVGCLMVESHCRRTLHAERNALIWMAKQGLSAIGATLYLTHYPCYDCTLMIVQMKLARVVYREDYRSDQNTEDMLEKAGIPCVQSLT